MSPVTDLIDGTAARIKSDARFFVQGWNRFWFQSKDPVLLSAFRLVFRLTFFIFYLSRQFDYSFLFTEKGLIPYELSLTLVPESYQSLIEWQKLVSNETAGRVLHILFLLGLLAMAFGMLGRKVAWLVFVIHLAFLKRNFAVIHGPDMVGTFWLFYLVLTENRRYFRLPITKKLRATWRLRPRASEAEHQSDDLTSVAVRLIQLQLCLIYAYSGVEKVKGITWWRGDAIWLTFANGQLVSWDLSFMHHFPLVIALMTFATLVWEIYFPFLILFPRLRAYILWFGVFLHLNIGLLINIPFFATIMPTAYLLFANGESLRRTLRQLWRQN